MKKSRKKKKTKKGSSSSTSSRLSTVKISQIVEQLKHEQHRSSTKKNYYTVWKLFNRFYIRLDDKPKEWTDRLTLFVGYLIQNNKQSSTVRSYISAIKAVLKTNNIKIEEDQYLLASLTKACRLRNDSICHRFPIRKSMLAIILKKGKQLFF